jgi:hypothetical protein
LAPPTVTSLRSFDTTTNFGASSPIFSPWLFVTTEFKITIIVDGELGECHDK